MRRHFVFCDMGSDYPLSVLFSVQVRASPVPSLDSQVLSLLSFFCGVHFKLLKPLLLSLELFFSSLFDDLWVVCSYLDWDMSYFEVCFFGSCSCSAQLVPFPSLLFLLRSSTAFVLALLYGLQLLWWPISQALHPYRFDSTKVLLEFFCLLDAALKRS